MLLTAGLPAAAADSRSGCIEKSSVTVEADVCRQLLCAEKAPNGTCTRWYCAQTQRTKYNDAAATGCTRFVDCGKDAVFYPGEPSDPDSDSTETCDWYPCVETDPDTGSCDNYRCVSKRILTTEKITYPNARCVRKSANSPGPGRRNRIQELQVLNDTNPTKTFIN